MTREEYNKHPGINFSMLKHYLRSPRTYKYYKDLQDQEPEDDEESKAIRQGKAAHALAFEMDTFKNRFYVFDESKRPVPDKDYKTKANSDWKKQQIEYAKNNNLTFLSSSEMELIQKMGNSMRNKPAVQTLLKGCFTEQFISWADPTTGVLCKGIIDFNKLAPFLHVGDLKTMEDCSPTEFNKYIAKWLTYVQLAFYGDGLAILHGMECNHRFIIAQEKKAPFTCQPYYLSEEDVEAGRLMYQTLLGIHKRCVESNHWGDYDEYLSAENGEKLSSGVIIAKLPNWVKSGNENNPLFINN